MLDKYFEFIEKKRYSNAYWIPGRRYIYNDNINIHHNKITRLVYIAFDLTFLLFSSIILSLCLLTSLFLFALISRIVFRKQINNDELFNNYLEGYYYNPAPCLFKFLEGKYFKMFSQSKMDLEIGIDNGQTSMLHFSGKRFRIGTEYSILWEGNDTLKYKDIWMHKLICDMRQLPIKSESCNTIASVHVIDHINGYKESITEIERVLKPGGSIILSTFSKNFLLLNIKSIFWSLMNNRKRAYEIGKKMASKSNDYNFYSESEWRENFKKLGLEVTEFKTFINGPIKYLYHILIQSPFKKNAFMPFQYWIMLEIPGHKIIRSCWKWINYSILYPAIATNDNPNDGPHVFMKIIKK